MLTCELCGAKLFAEVSAKLPAHIARKCLKEIERSLRSGHTKGCAFRFAPCPDRFKYVSATAAATLIAEFERRLESLNELKLDLPCVTMDEFEELDKIKRDSDLKDTPTELVILALLGWEHHSTAYNKFVFIRCGFCFRKVCTMFYRKLTREEELLVEEAQQRMVEQSKDSSPAASASGSSEDGAQSGSLEKKRRGSKDILEVRTAAQAGKKKRRPQDQLNPFFEHRSWCAWISKETREGPIGWKVLLDLLVSHHQRLQNHRASNQMSHAEAIEAAEDAVEKLRRRSDYWRDRLLPAILAGDTDDSENHIHRSGINNNNYNANKQSVAATDHAEETNVVAEDDQIRSTPSDTILPNEAKLASLAEEQPGVPVISLDN
ncbi:nuclear-interacting partner of ALK-like [Tropilaelaps mercedesae]|uniref:Nuclear-interacting partner of ALK-like n=1 Tax=Tropilaelaps mercedesae TaxID=418985 RepID=A0A1V9X8N6_9ACAR|nr:nuclear-interacting partner of ALK-like [Tropilaelaps mercedesae]